MYCGRSFEQWSIIELRKRLDAFGLSKVERKAELFIRFCTADPSGIKATSVSDDAIMDEENNGEQQGHNEEQQKHNEEGRQDNMADGSDGIRAVASAELSIRERKLKLLRREKDLIARELEILRLENANLRDKASTSLFK